VLPAVVAVGVGALVWSRTVTDDGDDVILLHTPGEYVDPSASNPPNDGVLLPRVALTTAAGVTAQLASDGRPMVVNLWYSTCPPCARELTYFAAVANEFGNEVRFVGVNPLDDAGTMQRFAAERGVAFELLRDPDGALEEALGVVQYPVTLFVDETGEIVAQTGVLGAADLRAHVAELLA
jgi:thiol-disulfide isomerase/thioredoxin